MSLPFVALSRFCEVFQIWEIRNDIRICLEVVDVSKNDVPLPFFLSLIAAEDHRNAIHPGVDPIAIVRAVYVRLRFGETQGASTIEQQFVRIVTGRFEKTASRKLREQILAISVARYRTKFEIASAYMANAFYGSRRIGLKGLISICGHDLSSAQKNDILGMISRLKYPEPLNSNVQWHHKIQRRIDYIQHRDLRYRISASQSLAIR